jgi:hypothetical protein
LFATIIGSVALGIAVAIAADQPLRSFVLLTARAAADRDAYLEAQKKSWYILGAWIFFTLAIGVVSNFIFYLALQYFAG